MKRILAVCTIVLFFSNAVYAYLPPEIRVQLPHPLDLIQSQFCEREWQSATLKSQFCDREFRMKLYNFTLVTPQKTSPIPMYMLLEQTSDATIVAEHKSNHSYYLLQSPLQDDELIDLLKEKFSSVKEVIDDRFLPFDKEKLCQPDWASKNLKKQICDRHYSPEEYDFYRISFDPIHLLHASEFQFLSSDYPVIAHHKESGKDYLIHGRGDYLKNCSFLRIWLKKGTKLELLDDRLLSLEELGIDMDSKDPQARYFLKTDDFSFYSDSLVSLNSYKSDSLVSLNSYKLYGQSPFCFFTQANGCEYDVGDCDMKEVRKWIPELKDNKLICNKGYIIPSYVDDGYLHPSLTEYLIHAQTRYNIPSYTGKYVCPPINTPKESSLQPRSDVIHSGKILNLDFVVDEKTGEKLGRVTRY